MKTDLKEIENTLKDLLKAQVPPLRIRHEAEQGFEVCGTKEAMQGRQKVDGFYFASVIPKSNDVRFYFFPIYTHPTRYTELSEDLRKALKGKSCFHIKRLSEEVEQELKSMIDRGVEIFTEEGYV